MAQADHVQLGRARYVVRYRVDPQQGRSRPSSSQFGGTVRATILKYNSSINDQLQTTF